MKKHFIKILLFTSIVSKSLMAGDTDRIIQSNILGTVSSLILPAKASVVVSLLPYIIDNSTEEMINVTNENSVLKNKKQNSSINYTNSIIYTNSLNK